MNEQVKNYIYDELSSKELDVLKSLVSTIRVRDQIPRLEIYEGLYEILGILLEEDSLLELKSDLDIEELYEFLKSV